MGHGLLFWRTCWAEPDSASLSVLSYVEMSFCLYWWREDGVDQRQDIKAVLFAEKKNHTKTQPWLQSVVASETSVSSQMSDMLNNAQMWLWSTMRETVNENSHELSSNSRNLWERPQGPSSVKLPSYAILELPEWKKRKITLSGLKLKRQAV